MPDLHRIHRPITDRFPREDRDYELTPGQRRGFAQDGFISGVDLLSPEDVSDLRTRVDSICRRVHDLESQLYEVESAWLDRPDDVVLHFLGGWMVDETLHDLVFHPGAARRAAAVLETDRLRFWHDQVFYKPPRHPGVVPWHQDYSYWDRTGPPAHVTVFIALDDMTADNGGLEYVPGSHRWGLLPMQEFGGDLDALMEHLSPEQRDRFLPEPVILRAGEASIHHSHLVHGSRPNLSDRPRRAVVLNYMADGTRVLDDSEALLRGVPIISKGRIVDGDHFPIAWSARGSDS